MTLARPLASPLFTGAGVSALVPGKWDCALNGHTFMIDWRKTYLGPTRFTRASISLLKPQQDTTDAVGEQSLNPEEFARRFASEWHHGAGQTFHDRPASDPARFRVSKGIDVWTKWRLSLLPDTTLKLASANTNLLFAAAGARLYVADGTAVRYSTDLTTWTAVTGLPAPAATGIASDGFTVYTTHAASGVYSTNTGTGASSSFNVTVANGICAYVKGRLLVSNDNTLTNITGGAAQATVLAHPNTAFRWVAAAEGPAHIYAAGYAGDKSIIYKTTIKADATALDIATVAGELPDGEIVRSLQGYLGMLLVGTDKGVRVFQLDTNGNLAGSSKVIPTTAAVFCFEPQDRYVWYGLTNYDTTSTGLGRVDLGEFTDTLTPAYATDLMATAQGAVQSAVTFLGLRVFTVSGAGVYAESANKVATGTIDSGLVAFAMPDTKVAINLDARHQPLAGSFSIFVSADGGSFAQVGANLTAGSTSVIASAGQQRAETFEVRLTLTRDGTATTTGPTITRWTLEANPAPGRGEFIEVPLLLFESVHRGDGAALQMDVAAEHAALISMEAVGAPIIYQDCLGAETVFLDDHQFLIDSQTEKFDGFNGTFVARLRRPRARS